MSRIVLRVAFMLLCMACFLSCSDMIGWVEFHHNANIERIESSAGQMRAQSDGDAEYTLNLIPSDALAYLRVTPENPDARISIRVDSGGFVDLPAGTYSGNVAPSGAAHVAEIRVTSPSGKTVKTYTVRINRGGGIYIDGVFVRGGRDGVVGGSLHFRITSPDRLTTYVSAEISASVFSGIPNDEWVAVSFPATTLYQGIEYRYGFMHDEGAIIDADPGLLIGYDIWHTGFVAELGYFGSGEILPLYSGGLQSYIKLYDDEWNDPYTFVVP